MQDLFPDYRVCYSYLLLQLSERAISGLTHLIIVENEQKIQRKCFAFVFDALFHLFFTTNSAVFVRGEKLFFPRAQSTLATPLMEHIMFFYRMI